MQRAQPKVLCVDDEPDLIHGFALLLRSKYAVTVASSGAEGLTLLQRSGPFAAIVSDMNMPEMDGADFLKRARALAPNTVRVLLTGESHIDAAVDAVNEGQIFRFLRKPCNSVQYVATVTAAVTQHLLLEGERILLQETLLGSIEVLTEIMALASPVSFGRATRVKNLVQDLLDHLGTAPRWSIELAAIFSQIAHITLPADTLSKLHQQQPLDSAERAAVDALPALTEHLLASIPRLEGVRSILAHYQGNFAGPGALADDQLEPIVRVGTRVLRVACDFDALQSQGLSLADAMQSMVDRVGAYDPAVLSALAVVAVRRSDAVQEVDVALGDIKPGMEFLHDVYSVTGQILVTRGHVVTPWLVQRFGGAAAPERTLQVKMKTKA